MSDAAKTGATVKHGKAKAFYDVFDRKGPGEITTHYCPGCGHGTASKLIAEAIDRLGVQDRVIFCSPVGCSVFAYYYFDCGNIQCSHGRAPAVATGLRRTLKDAVILCYQGDGDLAGIGLGAVLHAANRGENITIFFINNAIYGMTGGQMAPTTLIGQKTVTTPGGRSVENEGYPIRMAELIDSLAAPVFVERVSFGTVAQVMKARKVFRKAIENQVQGKGFSFVEVLSPCPVNWRMTPDEARRWMIENMEPVFPVKNFRDRSAAPAPAPSAAPAAADLRSLLKVDDEIEVSADHPHRHTLEEQRVMIAGFGGQGVMSAGILLAKGAVSEGFEATWLPSYGPEMRGGTAHANVVVSRDVIGAPVVSSPNVLIAMNGPSLDTFESEVSPKGLVLVNSSIVERKVRRADVTAVYVPATKIAADLRMPSSVSLIMVAAYAALSGVVSKKILLATAAASLKGPLVEANRKAIEAGHNFPGKGYDTKAPTR